MLLMLCTTKRLSIVEIQKCDKETNKCVYIYSNKTQEFRVTAHTHIQKTRTKLSVLKKPYWNKGNLGCYVELY